MSRTDARFTVVLTILGLLASPYITQALAPSTQPVNAAFGLWLAGNWPGLLLAGALWLLWRLWHWQGE